MPKVRMPDGAVVSFPDTMSADEIRTLIKSKYPDADREGSALSEDDRASPLPDALIEGGKAIIDDSTKKQSWGMDIARSLGTGVRQGIEGGIGGFGDANRITGDLAGWAAGKLGASEDTQETIRGVARNLSPTAMLPSTEDVQRVTTPVVGEHYQPQTMTGEYARTIGAFAPGPQLPSDGGLTADGGRFGQQDDIGGHGTADILEAHVMLDAEVAQDVAFADDADQQAFAVGHRNVADAPTVHQVIDVHALFILFHRHHRRLHQVGAGE